MKKLTKLEVEAQTRIILRGIEEKRRAERLAKMNDPAFKKAIEDLHKKHGVDKINKLLKAQGYREIEIAFDFNSNYLSVYLNSITEDVLPDPVKKEYTQCITDFLGSRNYNSIYYDKRDIKSHIQDELTMASVNSKSLEKLTTDLINKFK